MFWLNMHKNNKANINPKNKKKITKLIPEINIKHNQVKKTKKVWPISG